MTEPAAPNLQATRREFLQSSVATAATLSLAPSVYAAGGDLIKVGLIGCGGRGIGAAEDVLRAARGVAIVAIGDYFDDHPERGTRVGRERLINLAKDDDEIKKLGNAVDLPPERCFHGLNAYKDVIDAGVDYVILATPPGFRPLHLQYAVKQKKHIFTEKPVAVDAPGYRSCLESYAQAREAGLGIAAGTQRRHKTGYLETMKRIHGGDIGEIVAGRCYWNGGDIWFRPRRRGQSDLDYQIQNWYHFLWLCGDHYVEQHVHNLDVVNWAIGKLPERCVGMGGRTRPCKDPREDGHIFNFFAVDFTYPCGVHVLSMARQIDRTAGNISEALVGSKGAAILINDRKYYEITGEKKWKFDPRLENRPYIQEHANLIESIRAGKPINELKNVADSSMVAVMGRMAAYTGREITWEMAVASKQELMPANLGPETKLEVAPVPLPGKTEFV